MKTTPAPPADAGPRLPQVGDIVWDNAEATRNAPPGTPVPLPSIVVRVERPADPETAVVVQTFGTVSSTLGLVTRPYSPTPKPGHWCWPTPPPAPKPMT